MKKQPSLIFCILMDVAGYATYAVPGLGEFADILWAPISSIIFMITFGGWKGALGGFGNFIEEILPGTDFIPSFTIMWFIQNMQKKNNVTQLKAFDDNNLNYEFRRCLHLWIKSITPFIKTLLIVLHGKMTSIWTI